MSEAPQVSVVMAVHDAAGRVAESVAGVLEQEAVDLELVVVDDGSTDGSGELLEECARRDPRVRVIRQENRGLTRALIRGCAEARGRYIARNDAGDVSLPGRLRKQLRAAAREPRAAIVSCGTRLVGPAGEHLRDVVPDAADGRRRLLTLDPADVRAPSHHGTVLFPRALYERVGGYRSAFYFAQDLDLWIRLIERGWLVVVPEVLYRARVTPDSITGEYRAQQVRTARLILECARRRRGGLSEESVMRKAAAIRPDARRGGGRLARARALYFVGACLRARDPVRARVYFARALRAFPLHIRSAARLVLGRRE